MVITQDAHFFVGCKVRPEAPQGPHARNVFLDKKEDQKPIHFISVPGIDFYNPEDHPAAKREEEKYFDAQKRDWKPGDARNALKVVAVAGRGERVLVAQSNGSAGEWAGGEVGRGGGWSGGGFLSVYFFSHVLICC